MEFINHTPYPSLMFRTNLDGDLFACSVCTKVTYDITDEGIFLSDTQKWDVYKEITPTDNGFLDSDNVFKKGGTDILLFGKAKSPDGMPVRQMDVAVSINGILFHTVRVFGNRFWEKSLLGLAISTPELFTEMPLTLENAYGGKANWDGLEMPFGYNQFGKGYYWQKDDCINNPLPNIEDPANLIRNWSDQPEPAGVTCLPMSALRVKHFIKYDQEGKINRFDARFYNAAFPGMIAPAIAAGDEITVSGMSSKLFRFKIPDHKINMSVQVGENRKQWNMYIEQVGIDVEKKEAFIAYRNPITYNFRPHEKRICEIFEPGQSSIT